MAQRWFEAEKQQSEQAGRRAELLKVAERLVDATTLEQLCQIDDLTELERAVFTRLPPRPDDSESG